MPAAEGSADARLVLSNVRKAFGGSVALRDASFRARRGEILAIIGQNGAGKSTLMNVLAGGLLPDAGAILLDGAPYTPSSPRAARAAGVAMVHQELSLCPHLSVAENVLLPELPVRRGLLDLRGLHRRAEEVLARLSPEAPIPPAALAGELSPAAMQIVEIARAIAAPSCRVLILDEPTSSLSKRDTERLFEVLRALRAQGLTILYISHFLEEVKALADTFTVLRDGASVGEGAIADFTTHDIVEMMAGRPVERLFKKSEREPGEVVLELEDVAGEKAPKRASLSLRRGEVLGMFGLIGAGRTELLRAIFGLEPVRSGRVRVLGRAGPASPTERLEQGVGMLSEDRKGEGLCLEMSIADNVTLSRLEGLGPGPLIRDALQNDLTKRWIRRLAIKCAGPEQRTSELSGGNQQKIAMARLLHHDVDVLLLDEPTRGIDVGSKAQIYELIDELAASGKAVLMVSSYLPELLGTCDRICVMSRGSLGPAHAVADVDETSLLFEATGS
jgi:ribose transport system ATP-binding protein